MTIETLRVDLDTRSYDIKVGPDLIGRAHEFIAPLANGRPVFVVTDENVAKHHLAPLMAALAPCQPRSFEVAPGEGTKSFAGLESLIGRLLEAGLERKSLLVALGGGIIGDLVGFAAAVALRGVDFVQIPTSLLAQVDSSVGGKTGINVPHGKNLVGAFHQPRLVLADIGTLDSLPERERRAGYAEVVKYGLIDDPNFFAWLEENGKALIAGDRAARTRAVLESCRHKAQVVAADEREAGRRALLNLGHTFGHALEAAVGYGDDLRHGEAVAIGMVLAFELSADLGLCPRADVARVREHLKAVGLPTSLDHLPPAARDVDRLMAAMTHDKKVKDGRVVFVLARGIGRAFIADDVDPAAARAVLERVVGQPAVARAAG